MRSIGNYKTHFLWENLKPHSPDLNYKIPLL